MPWEKAPLSRVSLEYRSALNAFVEFGADPSAHRFLVAVLTNSLDGYLDEKADNRAVVAREILAVLHHAPDECWGSPDRVHRWIKAGGLRGHIRADARLQ